jgi:hypothetical protein
MLCHGKYAIGLIVRDEAFATPCVQGHNFGADCLFMANNASHGFTSNQLVDYCLP